MRFLRPHKIEWSTVMKRFLPALFLAPVLAMAQQPIISDDERSIELGQMCTAETSTAAVAAAGTVLVGVTTGTRPMIALERAYTSTGSSLKVELFEVAYTGGTAVTRWNRNQVIGGTCSGAMTTGVTATPVTAITTASFLAPATGNRVQIAQTTDAARIILKPLTQYVIRLTNTDASAADLGMRLSYRDLQP